MKILLVDDEFKKTQDIISVLIQAGFQDYEIVHRTNSKEARALLREDRFDLALIDIQLPDMLGSLVRKNGGYELFDALLLDIKCNLPDAVIFITGKEDMLEASEAEASKRGAQICFYSGSEEKWKIVLKNKVRYIAEKKKREMGAYKDVDIVIVTAMRSELEAVLALPYQWAPVRYKNNPVSFHKASVQTASGVKLSLVAASAYTKGMPSSAALATQMCLLFRPKYIAMLGICAGVKKNTSLGNVVIADPAWDWGSGKIAENSDGERVFMASPQQRPLNTHISQVCHDMSQDVSVAGRIRAGWRGKFPEGEFKVQVGPMASGASVLANISMLSEISNQNRDLIAVEMEAYAVMAAAEYALSPAPIAIAIKSVCDFADAKKSDDWQLYAAYTSAAFFDELIRSDRIRI